MMLRESEGEAKNNKWMGTLQGGWNPHASSRMLRKSASLCCSFGLFCLSCLFGCIQTTRQTGGYFQTCKPSKFYNAGMVLPHPP